MDFITASQTVLGWVGTLADWLAQWPRSYFVVGALLPLLLAFITRSALTICWTVLFLGAAVAASVTTSNSWGLFAALGIAAELLVAATGLARRRSQALFVQRLSDLQTRIAHLENNENRRFLQSLRSSDERKNGEKTS